MTSSNNSKKRSSSVSSLFLAVDRLETDDAQAAKRRRRVADDSVAKSKAARGQSDLFAHLMEARILLQRVVAVDKNSSSNSEVKNNSDDVNEATDALLRNLLTARRNLCGDVTPVDDTANSEHALQTSYEVCRSGWRRVLDERHHDLQLHAGSTVASSKRFRIVDQSFWTRVTDTVRHDTALNAHTTNDTNNNNNNDTLYQDDRLYRHLLKDFVRAGTTTSDSNDNDTAATSSRWQANKNSKQVDRRASKGRKIRYVVHPKLTNFTFPTDRETPLIHEDDWFKSLFGGSHGQKNKKGSTLLRT